jgi:hypothetical protein
MATRKKGGQRLIEMARKSRKAKESRVGGKRYVTPTKPKAKAAVTKRKGTTITYKPKPSPHLSATKKATKKAAPKAAPKSVVKKAAPKPAAKKTAPKKLTDKERKLKLQRLRNQMSEAGGMSKLASGLTKDIGDAEFATDLAITAATLPLGGGLGRGALTGAKAVGRAAKATGGALKTGAKATGRAAKKAAKVTKRAARKARVGLKKADRKLLKAQGLSRQGGKVRKIKEPNPFGKNAAKGSKPKVKSGKKNPFAGSAKPKAKGKQLDEHVKARYRLNERKARKAKKAQRKAAEQDAHVKAYKGDKIKKGKRKADKARKDAVAANKRAAEKAKALRVEKGYAQQRIDAQKASRARNRRRRS